MSVTSTTSRKRGATQLRMSEAELCACVIDLAHARNWLVFHALPLRRADGSWRTGTQGDKGYPDLTLVRRGPANWHIATVLFVELKSDRGRVSPEQQKWLDALSPYSAVWTPREWHSGEIERALR